MLSVLVCWQQHNAVEGPIDREMLCEVHGGVRYVVKAKDAGKMPQNALEMHVVQAASERLHPPKARHYRSSPDPCSAETKQGRPLSTLCPRSVRVDVTLPRTPPEQWLNSPVNRLLRTKQCCWLRSGNNRPHRTPLCKDMQRRYKRLHTDSGPTIDVRRAPSYWSPISNFRLLLPETTSTVDVFMNYSIIHCISFANSN